ncbi:hypothetical protein ABBQ38_002348 [Trebouxia sp. C0009 RCD-2024]
MLRRVSACLTAVALCCSLVPVAGIRITTLDREAAVTHQLITVTDTYNFHNDAKSSADALLLCSTNEYAATQAFQEITVGDDDDAPVLQVETADTPGQSSNITCFKAKLEEPLTAGSSIVLEWYSVHVGLMVPFPAKASQSDPQRVLLKGSHYAPSPYPVATQTTKLKLSSKVVLRHTELAPTKRQGRTITFGAYRDMPPWSISPLSVHFENNNPFIRVTKLVRELEVSHWGNVYVDEKYYIRNDGAKHRGEWSRLDLQRNPAAFGKFALSALTAKLPAAAHTFYFRDEIGNISSSNIRFGRSNVLAELRPRFPLYGGWKAEFTFGYSLPLSAILTKVKGSNQLEASFSSPFDRVVVDDLTVKVVLPEGASSISAKVPFPVNQSREVKHTYLDTSGRPVVVLHKTNLVPDHDVPFTVTYSFYRILMLREPALLVGVFALLFVSILAYVRCDFVLSRDDKWHADRQHEKAVTLVQRYTGLITERRNALSSLDYSMVGGADGAAGRRAETEALMKKTAEEMRSVEQQHSQVGAGDRHALLVSLRDKESAMQTNSLQLFGKRLQLLQEKKTMEEADSKLASQIRSLEDGKKEVTRLAAALLKRT